MLRMSANVYRIAPGPSGLRVLVAGDQVILDGWVASFREKKQAGDAFQRSHRRLHVVNRLRICPVSPLRRTA
jgi:hypothetical protein